MTYTTGLDFTLGTSSFTTGTDFNFNLSSDTICQISSPKLRLKASTLLTTNQVSNIGLLQSAKLRLKTSIINASQPFAQGFNAFLAPPVYTNETNTFLSHELEEYVESFSLDIIQVSSAILIDSITNNNPTVGLTTAITVTNARSYFSDFYNRFHITPLIIELGALSASTSTPVTIWNSYFTQKTLSVITTGIDGYTSGNITLPAIAEPLGILNFNAEVDFVGAPTFNGFLDLDFVSETYNIAISGTRASFLPAIPLFPFTETKSWLTEIIPTITSEGRTQLRDIPRQEFNYTYNIVSDKDLSYLERFCRNNQTNNVVIPFNSEFISVGNLTIGQTILSLDATKYEYYIGCSILIWESQTKYETGKIVNISSTNITIAIGIKETYTNAWIAPLLLTTLKDNGDITEKADHFNTLSVTFIANSSYTKGEYPLDYTYNDMLPDAYDSFAGLPILEQPYRMTSAIGTKYTQDIEVFDTQLNGFEKLETQYYSRKNTIVEFIATTRDELYTLRRHMDFLKGKFNLFWLPTQKQDLFVADPNYVIPINGTTITVNACGLVLNPIKYIRVIDKFKIYNVFTIISIVDNLNNTETLTFSTPNIVPLSAIARIEIIDKVRLDTDSIALTYDNKNIAKLSVPVLEVA